VTVPAQVPVDLGREAAAALAREELADPVYRAAQPSLLEQVLRWISDQLGRLVDTVGGTTGGGWAAVVLVLVVLAAAAVAVRWGVGPVARRRRVEDALDTRAVRAADLRAEAEAHAAAGRWDEAVRARLRAVVRTLEDRGVLDPRPGRTADEVAAEAGVALPAAAPALVRAAHTFDDVWFGGRTADPLAYRAVVEADEQVAAGRPAGGGPAAVPGAPDPLARPWQGVR
jgi:hypothetical protein